MNPATKTSNTIGQRLKLEMKKSGLTSAEVAKQADVKTSFIYDVISGKSANPSPLKLARVAEILHIDLSDLVSGSAENKPVRLAQGDYVTIPRIMVDASAGGGSIVTLEQEGESYFFRKEWIKEHLGTRPEDLRMLTISGDSMEPTLCHNDIILIDTTKKTPTPPGIFVLFDGFGLVAKRVEFVTQQPSARLRITSDNHQYSTYERSAEETFIIGRVVWFAREM